MSCEREREGCASCGAPDPTAPVPVEDGCVLCCESCAIATMTGRLDRDELDELEDAAA